MKLDLLRSGKQAAWLVAYPGLLALVRGQVNGEVCGLRVVESSGCAPGAFYLTHRWPA